MKYLGDPSSGSQAGTTASRNRFGQYKRTRAIPVQPRTPKQTTNRSQMATASSAWRFLTDAQRTAWNDYAAQISRSDSLGSSYNPTGASLYVGSSIASVAVGTVGDPPTLLPQYFFSLTGMAYVDSTPGPEALNAAIQVTNADNLVLVETSGPVSPGITSAAAVRRWRSLPTAADNLRPNEFSMNATPIDLITQYKYLFPSPVTGQTIWFRFSEVFWEPLGSSGIANKQKQTFRLVIP